MKKPTRPKYVNTAYVIILCMYCNDACEATIKHGSLAERAVNLVQCSGCGRVNRLLITAISYRSRSGKKTKAANNA